MANTNNGLKILDLGCGKRKINDAIGVDRVKLDEVDIVHDLTKFPYPFEDNSIDSIYCRHLLEHFDVDVRSKALAEVNRILKKGGQAQIRVPHVFSIGAFRDPTHKSFFTFESMVYYTENHFFSYYDNICFKIVKKWANVQIFGDWATPTKLKRFSKLKSFINNIFSKILNRFLRISDSFSDLIVKTFPFYEVEIIWVIEKV